MVSRPPRESPKALDAERALLGGLIEEPERLADVDALGPLGRDKTPDFAQCLSDLRHQMLYRLLRKMTEDGATIDLVTIIERVRPCEGPYGGVVYVMDLQVACVSSVNLEYYAGIVVEWWRLGKLLAESETLAEAATTGATSTELATATAARLLEVVEGSESRGWSEAWEGGADVIDRIDSIREGSTPPGLAFGMPSVDEVFRGGIDENSYTLFLGRPAKGKTAGMLGRVERWASLGVRCAVFSLEMSRRQLFTRTLSRMTGIALDFLREPKRLSEGQLRALRNAATLLRSWPLHVDDTPGITIEDIHRKVRALKLRYPDLMVVATDYIQKVQSSKPYRDDRERIARASWGHRMLGSMHGLRVLSAAQLGRAADDVVFPSMSMIEGCSALEQDVTGAIAMLRPLPNDDRSNEGDATWYVIKQRDGAGEVPIPMRWDGATTSFTDPRSDERPMDVGGSLLDQVGQPGKVREFRPRGR